MQIRQTFSIMRHTHFAPLTHNQYKSSESVIRTCVHLFGSRGGSGNGSHSSVECYTLTNTHSKLHMFIAKFLHFSAGMWKKGTISEEMWHFGRKSECTQMDATPQLPFCSFSSSFVARTFSTIASCIVICDSFERLALTSVDCCLQPQGKFLLSTFRC